MELKRVEAKKLPHRRQRVYHPRSPHKKMLPLNPQNYCGECGLWIPPAVRQTLRANRPQEEWGHHPDCWKKKKRREQLAFR